MIKPTSATRLFAELAPLLGVVPRAVRVVEKHTVAGLERLRGREILVVDDVALNREVVRDMLENTGVRIRFAGDGQEAIDAVMAHRPDCILMDCQMPVMDGYEATRIIRGFDQCQDLPIIAFTANALVSEQERCRDAGMDGYVTKPIRKHELLSALVERLFQLSGYSPDVSLTCDIEMVAAETQGETQDIPGVDQQVGLRYIGGSEQHYRHLLHTFADTHGRVFAADFNAAINRGDWESATRYAHSMKSSARLIGAENLGELASKLEAACLGRQSEIVTQLTEPALQELERVVEGITRTVQD